MGNTFVLLKPVMKGLLKAIGMKSKMVEIEPGTTMHFWVPNDTIKTTKPPVVFLHGFVADGFYNFPYQVLALRKSFAIYLPDLMFFGDSITDRPERSADFQAECLAKGMMKLGVEKFALVGFCYGGLVGFKFAQLYPQMVESMVISSTGMELTESISNASLKNIGFTNWPDFLMPKTVSGVKGNLAIATHWLPWLPEFFFRDFLEAMFPNREERVELVKALVISDKDATTPNYSQRIFLLCGDDDKIFNKTVIDTAKEKLGENATVHYIKRAGHFVQIERPIIYTKYLKEFLHAQVAQRKCDESNK